MYPTRAGSGGAQDSTDTSARAQLRSCPDGPLGDFLRDITPPGAPALRLALDDPPCPLPLTAPWLGTRQRYEKAAAQSSDVVSRLRHTRRAGLGEDWALEAVDAIFKPTKPELRRALATWIATDARTADGLPTLSSSPVRDALTLRLLLGHPRGTLPALQLAAAVRIDIHERRPFEPNLRRLTEWLEKRDATTARRQRRLATPGRRQHAELGVWPWTHAHDGVLPPDWRSDPAFIEPLNEWWQRSHTAAATAVVTHKRAWERWAGNGR